MMTIFVLDNDAAEDGRDWPALIGRSFTKIDRQGLELVDSRAHVIPSDAAGVLIIHTSYFPASALPDLAEKFPKLTVLALNAGGLPQGPRGDRYWSVATPVRKKPLDSGFASRVQEFLQDLETHGRPDFPLLEPQDNEVLLTFRLLCEAWLLKNWPDRVTYPELQTLRTTLRVQGEKPQLPEGIDLRPPSNRDEWLTPFREVGDTIDPLPEILNGISSDEGKAVVNDFFSESEVSFAPTFDNVADLFLKLNAALKASA